ncbi:hypothetical protein ACQUWY_18855, partial [Ralstonia pseudosolanacearum]
EGARPNPVHAWTAVSEDRLDDMRGGYDAYTPDLLPIVGFTDDRSRVAVAFGFSGRGAKYIPALMSDFAGDIVHRVRHLN